MLNPAEIYEQYFGPAMFEPSSELLLALAAPQLGERVLDLACGTGRVTRMLPPLVGPRGTVVAIDPSPPMLAIARALPAPEGAAITWKEGNAVELAEPDASYDLVTIQHGLQFFPDKRGAARHVKRVLVPGGRVVLSCWQGLERHDLVRALFEAEAKALGTTVDKIAAPFSFGDPEAIRRTLADAGFENIELVEKTIDARFPQPEQYVRLAAMGAAAVIPGFPSSGLEDLIATVSATVGELVKQHTVGEWLVMPMVQTIAIARA